MAITNLINESDLIQRLRQGERPAFDDLVELYKNKGLAISYRFAGNLEDAKDILQEAFIKVYLNIRSFKKEAKFSTWFYRIVVNCSLDLLRKRKSSSKVIITNLTDKWGKEKDAADTRLNPQNLALNKELERELDNCISDLPKNQKTCFILKYQNNFDNAEIAQLLHCSYATVKVHIFRALKALRNKLAGYFLEQEAKDV